MADAAILHRIFEHIQTVSSYADLKAIRLELLRRQRELDARRAAQFEPQAQVSVNRSWGSPLSGVVQRVEGANVLVKMAHGFVARIPAEKLRITSGQDKSKVV